MSEMDFDELDEEAQAESNSSNQYTDVPYVGMQPRAAIKGTIVDVGFSGNPYATQNVRGASQEDGGDFIFTLANPEVVLGDCFEARGREQIESGLIRDHREAVDMEWEPGDPYAPIIDAFYDLGAIGRIPRHDYKLVDEGGENVSSNVEKIGGDFTEIGVEYGPVGNEFPTANGTPTAEISEEHVAVFQGSQAGRKMMQALDVTQGLSAYIDDDNDKTVGMMEYPRDYGTDSWSPSNSDYPRVARQPQLHPEFEGQEVILYLRFGDTYQGNRAHLGEVILYDEDAGSLTDMPRLTAQNTDDLVDPQPDEVDPRDVYLQFHEPDGGWDALGDGSSDGSSSESSDDSASSGSDSGSSGSDDGLDFSELDGGADDDSADDESGPTTYEDLSPDEQTFVDGVVTHADNNGANAAAEAFKRGFDDIVKAAQADGDLPSEANADTLESIIDEQIAAGVVPS